MRVLVATDQWFPDLMGGVARVATETSRRWAAAGHDVVVLAPRHPGRPARERDGRLEIRRVLPRGRLPKTLSDPLATRFGASRLRDARFDVAVAHTSTTAVGLLTSRLGSPLVYVFHADPVAESQDLRATMPLGLRKLRMLATEQALGVFRRRSLLGASTIVVLSEYTRGLIAERDGESARRALKVSGAVDTDVFTPEGREESRRRLGIEDDAKLVFTVRRLVERMGLAHLVDATALLTDVAGLRVVVAGSGPLEAELRARSARLGPEAGVTFLGRVDDDDLPHWHRAADLFVLPTAAYEGFGLVTAEALASGTPVVGTPVGATPELLRDVEPRLVARGSDPESLAAAIRASLALTSDELRRRARVYALDHLSWNVTLPLWEDVLVRTVEQG